LIGVAVVIAPIELSGLVAAFTDAPKLTADKAVADAQAAIFDRQIPLLFENILSLLKLITRSGNRTDARVAFRAAMAGETFVKNTVWEHQPGIE
jgi:hypothetical protein